MVFNLILKNLLDPFANEPMLSIEKRLAGIEGAENFKKDRKLSASASMSLNKLIKTLEGKFPENVE